MKLPVLLLANAAAVNNELLDVQGGGWQQFSCESFPWGVQGSLCGILEVSPEERDEPQQIAVSVRDHSGQDLGFSASMVILATRGDGPARAAFAFAFAFAVQEPSLADFVVSSGDEVIGTLSIPIRSLPSNLG